MEVDIEYIGELYLEDIDILAVVIKENREIRIENKTEDNDLDQYFSEFINIPL